jgi:cobalt-zinc-cadmium efflux system outer membrane protein
MNSTKVMCRAAGGLGLSLALMVLLSGCAKVEPQPDYARAHQLIQESTGVVEAYDPEQGDLSEEQINAHLADGLTLDEAVRLALLNNRQLQGSFHDIGISRADWVQAGLLSNPSLGIGIMFPEGGGRSNLQANIAQNIVDLWQMPVRKRVAEHELESRILHVARMAGELTAETKRAYYHGLATQELLIIAEKYVELLTKSLEAIRTHRIAGMASSLDENLQRAQVLDAELSLRDARLAAENAKRALARLLSLDRDVDNLELIDAIPEVVAVDFDADALIALARDSRLDLRGMAESILAGDAEIELEYLGVFPEVSLGIGSERLEKRGLPGRKILADTARASLRNGRLTAPDITSRGERRLIDSQRIDFMWGPTVALELPMFDQNQAQIARARYARVQAVKTYEDLYLSIAQDIRIAVDRASTLWGNASFYREDMLPLAETNQDFTDAAYQAGTVSILTLLASQRALLDAHRGYVLVLSDAAASLADLERAVGLPLDTIRTELASTAPPEPASPEEEPS